MAPFEGVTERLKAANQTELIRPMNSIRAREKALVLREIVYGE